MLVLSRKSDQAVLIGETIKVTVVRVRGNVVTLGIEAPKSVRVLREEIAGQAPKMAATDQPESQAPTATHSHPNPKTDESPSDSSDTASLSDLEDMLYEPEDYATQAAFASPLAQYMFAP